MADGDQNWVKFPDGRFYPYDKSVPDSQILDDMEKMRKGPAPVAKETAPTEAEGTPTVPGAGMARKAFGKWDSSGRLLGEDKPPDMPKGETRATTPTWPGAEIPGKLREMWRSAITPPEPPTLPPARPEPKESYVRQIATGKMPLRSMQPGLPSAFQDPETARVAQALTLPAAIGEGALEYGIPRALASIGTSYLGGKGAGAAARYMGAGPRGEAGAEMVGSMVGGGLPFIGARPVVRGAAPPVASEGTLPRVGEPPPAAPAKPTEPPPAGPRQGPRAPTASEALDSSAMRTFGKRYDALTPEQQRVAASRMGGPTGEQRVTRGQSPTGQERRAEEMPLPSNAPVAPEERRAATPAPYAGPERRVLPGVYERSGYGKQPTPGEQLAADIRTATGQGSGITEAEAQNEIKRDPAAWERFTTATPKEQGAMLVGAKNRLIEARQQPASTLPSTPAATAAPGAPGAAPGVSGTTLPRTPRLPRSVTVGPSTATLPTIGGGEPVPKAGLEDILRRATGQPEPTPLKPNVPLGEQLGVKKNLSEAAEDPLKVKYPDPGVRRFVRANGEGIVQATEGRPEVLQAVHDLKNWEVRQAAINSGIDVGQQHVGSRQGLGPAQVSRQALLDQMINQGVKPEDIPKLAQIEPVPYTKPMPIPNRFLGGGALTSEAIHHHELAHAIIGGLDGFEQYGIVSHRNPSAGKGASAAAMFRLRQFANPASGLFRPEKLVGRIDDLSDLFAAGAAVNELIDGIPRYENVGLAGDRKSAARLFAALDIPSNQHQKYFDAATERAIAKLQKPGILEIIKDEATRREDNLPVGYHYSANRIEHILERVRRETTPQYQLERHGQGQLFGPTAGAAEPAGRGGGQAVAGTEGAGPRAAAEAPRLKPFRPPRTIYTFEISGPGEPPRYVTHEALNAKQAFRQLREKYPSFNAFRLHSWEEPEVGPPVEIERKLENVPPELARWLEPDEREFLQGRSILQKSVVKQYNALKPSLAEVVNVAKAGHGLGGWWQRFMDTFAALGEPTKGMEDLSLDHVENLKAFHGALSGNKAVEQANRIAWGAYRDWLEAGQPTDLTSINRIVRDNRGISGRNSLDTQKLFKLVNSPQLKRGVPFTGEAFVRSPVEGVTPGAKKIPSMVATTAGKGNLKRVVFDTHMKDLYGLNDLTDAQYLAASIHIRQAGEALGYTAGEAQEQMWGTVLGLKQLLGRGLGPKAAAARYGPDILASIGKDYAEVILDGMKNDPEMREIMEDLKKFGFDPGGPIARGKLETIVEQGRQRMAEPAPRLSRQLLTRTARRIASSRAGP